MRANCVRRSCNATELRDRYTDNAGITIPYIYANYFFSFFFCLFFFKDLDNVERLSSKRNGFEQERT